MKFARRTVAWLTLTSLLWTVPFVAEALHIVSSHEVASRTVNKDLLKAGGSGGKRAAFANETLEWHARCEELRHFIDVHERLPDLIADNKVLHFANTNQNTSNTESTLARWLNEQLHEYLATGLSAEKVMDLANAHVLLANSKAHKTHHTWKRSHSSSPDFILKSLSTPLETFEPGHYLSPKLVSTILEHAPPRLVKSSCTTCAIVGGATHLLQDNSRGSEIDDHDCVFRMNRGLTDYSSFTRAETSGEKVTHYMFYCCWDNNQFNRDAHRDAADWLFLPTEEEGQRWLASSLKDGEDHPIVIVDPRFVDRIALGSKPLAGTIMIAAALDMCSAPIDLYGFDTANPSYTADSHDPIEDHSWMMDLQHAGGIKIHK